MSAGVGAAVGGCAMAVGGTLTIGLPTSSVVRSLARRTSHGVAI